MDQEDYIAQWCVEGFIKAGYLWDNRAVENPDFPFWMYDERNDDDAAG